jgi:hypothetical protein
MSIAAARLEDRLIASGLTTAVNGALLNLIGVLRRVDRYDPAAERAATKELADAARTITTVPHYLLTRFVLARDQR